MYCRVPLVTFCLFVVTSCQGNPTQLTQSPTAHQPVIDGLLHLVNNPNMNEMTLNSIKESTNKFIQNVHNLLREINHEKVNFLINIEKEEIIKFVRQINKGQCAGEHNFQKLKDYFLSRFLLLEFPVRAAVAELEGKVSEMKRYLTLDRGIVDVKLMACELVGSEGHCANISAPQELCLKDSCEPLNEPLESGGSLADPGPKPVPSNQSSCVLRATGPLPTECATGQFQCQHSEQCIDSSLVCDGYYNCEDESDEGAHCKGDCSGKRCKNLVCIDDSQVCDGFDDCGDGTDEENCVRVGSSATGTLENCNLKDEHFLCSDRTLCLSVKSLCDGEADCSDNSDEGESCNVTTGCDRCAAMGGACLRSPTGPICLSSCPSGFVLDLESGLCILSNSLDGKRIVYKNYSYFGCLNKINILYKRLTNGFNLLKKYTNNKILETADDLNKCIHKRDNESLITLF